MIRTPNRLRRGATIVWVVLVLTLLIAFAGLACDVGYGVLIAHQLQNAADAAALAGAERMKVDLAAVRLAAVDTAAANDVAKAPVLLDSNDANDPAGDVVIGRYDQTTDVFDTASPAPNAVMVVAARSDDSLNGSLPLVFGPIFGVDTVDVARSAVAVNHGATGAGLIALCGDCECSFRMSGDPTLNLDGGPMQINSDADCAACLRGSGSIVAPEVNVAGDVCVTGGAFEFEGDIHRDAQPIGDPLAFLPEPAWDPADDLGAVTDTGTYGPGYYSGGIQLTTGDVTLLPGVYVLDGPGLHIGGNTRFMAEGVMIFIPPGTGFVDIDGTGDITITPPDPEELFFEGAETYEGVSIFQSRSNTNESEIIGTGLLDLEGTLYFPAANLRIGGTGDGFGSQLIAYTIELFGTGDITINYDGRFPAPGDLIFLVK